MFDLKETELFVNKAIGTLAVLGLLAGAAMARPDLNAFLNKKVETTAQLVAQARSDKEVMDRFMRHYGMTRAEVINFLGSLKPDTIRQEGVYAVYSVPEGGRIKLRVERLKQGEKVFSSQDGEPQMILKCGNPLTMGPKTVVASNRTPVTTTEVMVEESPLVITTAIEAESEPLVVMQPAEPQYTLVTPPTTQGPDVDAIPFVTPSGFNPLPLALGGLLFLDNGSSSSNPVPEPMTIAAFGAGVAYLGVRRRRKAAK